MLLKWFSDFNRCWLMHICVICSTVQDAEWHIYASFNQIRQVRIDAHKRQHDNFSLTCNKIFNQYSSWLDTLFLIISCKLTKTLLSYEVWFKTILLSLGYKTSSKKLDANSCLVTHNNVAMNICNNVLHTYPHSPWKFQVMWVRTFLVMQYGIQQQCARPRLQLFLQNT